MLTVVRFSIVDEFHSEATNVSRARLYYTSHIYIYIYRGPFAFQKERKIDRARILPHACRDRRNFINYAKSRHVWGNRIDPRSYRLDINRNHGYVTVSNVGCCGYIYIYISEFPNFLFLPVAANYAAFFFYWKVGAIYLIAESGTRCFLFVELYIVMN